MTRKRAPKVCVEMQFAWECPKCKGHHNEASWSVEMTPGEVESKRRETGVPVQIGKMKCRPKEVACDYCPWAGKTRLKFSDEYFMG